MSLLIRLIASLCYASLRFALSKLSLDAGCAANAWYKNSLEHKLLDLTLELRRVKVFLITTLPHCRRVLAIQADNDTFFSLCCVGTDKHADNLTRAASSLLLYQNVLKNRPAQAFLKLLLFLQKGRVQDILEAYGEFYSSLAAGTYLSWQDFLLEEVSL